MVGLLAAAATVLSFVSPWFGYAWLLASNCYSLILSPSVPLPHTVENPLAELEQSVAPGD